MLSNATQRRATRRASTVVLAVGALLAGGAASASAATLGGSSTAPVYTGEAAATIANSVDVTQIGDDTTFTTTATDLFSADPANGACVRAADNLSVTCTATGLLTSITVNGGAADETVTLTDVTVAVTVDGGPGNDQLTGSNSVTTSTTLRGGLGDDVLNAGMSAATLEGGAGDDSLNGGQGNDILNGGDGDDILSGGDGDDMLDGGNGDDFLTGGAGADDIHGGASVNGDVVSYQPTAENLTISLDDVANDAGQGDNVHSDVEAVQTDTGNDTLTGGPGANFFDAGAGDDVVNLLDGAADLGADCGDGIDILYADAVDLPNPFDTCEAAANKNSLPFGSFSAGQSTAAQTVTITNTGAAGLTLGNIVVTGPFNTSGCSGATIAVGQTCTVSTSFAPAAVGAQSGTLTIPNAAGGRPFVIALSGTGVAPVVVTPPGTTTPGGTTPAGTTPAGLTPAGLTPTGLIAAKSVSAKAKPLRDRVRPYAFTISGTVALPSGVTKAKGCSGTVTITLKRGLKTVTTKKGTLKSDCTYSAKVTVKFKAKMKATVRFGGNSAVGARSSLPISLRAG